MTFTSPLETNIWIGKGEILRPKNILKNIHPHSHGCWVGKKIFEVSKMMAICALECHEWCHETRKWPCFFVSNLKEALLIRLIAN